VIFTYRSPSVLSFFGSLLVFVIVTGVTNPAFAQKAWSGKRAPRVEVTEVKTRVLTNFANVQGRVIAGPGDLVTATTDAITRIGDIRLGDLVTIGDVIATQDSAQLELQLTKLKAKLREANVKLADRGAELKVEAKLLDVTKAQAVLLAGKAKRAQGLVANNALAADAAEMAINASMTANLALLARESLIARKKAQQEISRVTIIKSTLRSPSY
jgi:multidrug resistance efflux pump